MTDGCEKWGRRRHKGKVERILPKEQRAYKRTKERA